MSDLRCPNCESLDVTGHEITGLYDGILYWVCVACDYGWPIDFGVAYRLNQSSKEYAARHNKLQRWRENNVSE